MGLFSKLFGGGSTTIASASVATIVRLRGTVRCGKPLVAPYTKRPCVYWRLEIRESKFGGSWAFEDAKACDFAISDETGRAIVFADTATYNVPSNIVEYERASQLSADGRQLIHANGGRVAEIAEIEICEAAVVIDKEIKLEGMAMRDGAGQLVFERSVAVIALSDDAVFLRRGHDY